MKKQEQIDALRFRIERIESHLAEQHKGASFNPEPPECVANNGVSSEPIKPDFIPDWKDAPEDAVCVAMDKDGRWYWYKNVPDASFDSFIGKWINKFPDIATNAHLLPSDYWKGTLMMRPDAENDYTHLLPDGYEFCQESDAEKWVKVEKMHIDDKDEYELGHIENFTCFTGRWKPIRPIQYKVTTHEIVTAVPDPYQPDWSKAPDGVVAHAWDANGMGYWYRITSTYEKFRPEHTPSPFTLPPDLDWKQSLRVKPN